MSNAVWTRLMAQIRQADYRGQVGLYLHHEPLLVRSLYDKIAEVNATTNAHVVLSTNGALLDHDAQERMIAANPRMVHININSAEKTQYEEMMGLDYNTTFRNARNFIDRNKAKGHIWIEINCPILPGVDVQKLVEFFPDVHVNTGFWANSRGGLLKNVSATNQPTRFNMGGHCNQPTQNFNVLWDGSVIACCMDWAHETKGDFPNIMDADLFEIYSGPEMTSLQAEFKEGRYSRYEMCIECSKEMGFTRVDA